MRVFYYFNPSISGNPKPDYIILDDILTCRRIKISKISKANDPTEFQYSFPDEVSQDFVDGFREEFTKIDTRFGFISFSERCDSVLMWSHYAVKHTGLALELEMPKHLLTQVTYATHAPEIIQLKAKLSDKCDSRDHFFATIMSTKALCWSYEKERRMIVSFNHPPKGMEIQREEPQTKDGQLDVLHFYKFPAASLKSVFMGVKCEMEEGVLREKLREANLEHVDVYRFSLARNGFEIECPRYFQERKERLKRLISSLHLERNAKGNAANVQ